MNRRINEHPILGIPKKGKLVKFIYNGKPNVRTCTTPLKEGMTVLQVLGCGIEKGTREYEVEGEYEMELLPKQQINIIIETERVNEIVELVKQELYTGHIGDGKIFVYKIDNAIRVRTGDEGIEAL